MTNILCPIVLLICSLVPSAVVKDKIIQASVKAGVDANMVLYVAQHESNFGLDPIGDTEIICPRGINKGKPVYARGPFQITRCYHPEVTDEQAFDIDWSLKWALKYLADEKSCKREWTTCRNYYYQYLAKN